MSSRTYEDTDPIRADQLIEQELGARTGDNGRLTQTERAAAIKGRTLPARAADLADGHARPTTAPPADNAEGGDLPDGRELSDVGNADRFTRHVAGRALYCGDQARWYVFDGRQWCADDTATCLSYAKETARGIFQEAAAAKSLKLQDALAKWAMRSQAAARIDAMIGLARPDLAVRTDDFDRDPMLLNVQNGTLDLLSGDLCPHDPVDRLTKMAATIHDPNATCPRWEKFLEEIMAGDAEMIGYLQRLAGLCLTADNSEQALWILHGGGRNGKSVFLDTLQAMLGDYAAESAPDLLVERKHPEHPTEIADLCGRRLVVASETERGGRLRAQLVKRLTGDQTLKARYMRENYFSFRRTHKLLWATNSKPQVPESTLAIWRRIRLIPFTVTIDEAHEDKQLTDKLRDEWPGILRWALEGCRQWRLAKGLGEPDRVLAATATYRRESDPLGEFLDDRIVEKKHSRVTRDEVWRAYENWIAQHHDRPEYSRRDLYEELRNRGLVQDEQWRRDGRPVRGFQGIDLKDMELL